MKNQWSQFPFVLRRKILLTFLAGIASIAVSLVIFTVTADRILLVLGGFIFAASLVLGLAGCAMDDPASSGSQGGNGSTGKREVNVCSWGEYIDTDLITDCLLYTSPSPRD